MWRVRKRAVGLLYPVQIGIAVTSPAEAVNQAIHNILHTMGSSEVHGLLKIDLKNAFNLVSRLAILK